MNTTTCIYLNSITVYTVETFVNYPSCNATYFKEDK